MNTLAMIFTTPLRVPTQALSLLWALPICLCIALVYKAIRLEKFNTAHVVREVAWLFLTIIGFLILVGAGLIAVSALSRHI